MQVQTNHWKRNIQTLIHSISSNLIGPKETVESTYDSESNHISDWNPSLQIPAYLRLKRAHNNYKNL